MQEWGMVHFLVDPSNGNSSLDGRRIILLLENVKELGVDGGVVDIFLMVEVARCWVLKHRVLDGWAKASMRSTTRLTPKFSSRLKAT